MYQLADHRLIRPSETALALKLLTEMELLRLKTIARLHARGLPPEVGWDDLLQEAITRVLTGSRRRPRGVPLVAFIAEVMRSLRSGYWRRAGRRAARGVAPPALGPDPERSVSAAQELEALHELFAHDAVALEIIRGLGEGLTPERIRAATGLTKTAYDSARKRIRRCLLREGLTCEAK